MPHKLRRPIAAILIAGTVFSATLAARFYLASVSDPDDFDSSPLPRQHNNAPFIVSPDVVVDEMVKIAELSSDDLVYDLGCGDGRIVISSALASGCSGVGFDIDPERVTEAQRNVQLHGVEDLITIEQADIFDLDLRDADVVMMYLLPWMLKELIPQFDAMPPGRRIVSHDFKIAQCKPDKTIEVFLREGNLTRSYVYLWITPLKKGTDVE
jgi:SAM-dependent methyltransferase